MSLRDAEAAKRDLYRFKMFLMSTVDTTPDDDHCRALMTIASRAVLRVEPVAVEDDRGTHMVTLSLNPIVRSMLAHQRGDTP
jgi:hypothetical protein